MSITKFLKDVWAVKETLFVILVPLLLLPLPLTADSQEAKCAYGLVVMAILWITESLPLAVTALLPIILFPMLGVVKVSDVCSNYIKDSSMFGFGGLTIAIAVEKWNLHKRIALKALLLVGSEPKWLMLGFMLPTWFLSMWVSNTATTAMMIPIVGAVMEELKSVKPNSKGSDNRGYDSVIQNEAEDEEVDRPEKNHNKKGEHITVQKEGDVAESDQWNKGMCLCVAYAANVGGTGSLSGTTPNIIMQGQADIIFEKHGLSSGVNFASWMVFALPGSLLCLILTWLWLQFLFLGWRSFLCCKKKDNDTDQRVKKTIRDAYKSLGPISFSETTVLVHFILLVILWFSRDPPYVDGWGIFFQKGYVGDSVVAILIVTSLFVFPSERPKVFFFRRRHDTTTPRKSVAAILDWESVHQKFPWGVLLLIGGGFALADASEVSGLSLWIGDKLTVFGNMEPWLMNLILTIIVAFATEVTSNTATATLLLPIIGNIAENLGMNPLYLMFPCAIATSFAFMLPVATPPNAIVFANGSLKVSDMAKAGAMLNVICILVLSLATNTWGMAYFNLDVPIGGNNRTTSVPSNRTI
ncbi:hypothetical protein ScPMuIL_016034 [Solemya velum]